MLTEVEMSSDLEMQIAEQMKTAVGTEMEGSAVATN